jgi:5-amino-6-(5-phosphoribosylamino)uracil reductase/diaminohydroxyphosphoribosylaminopyrimidine deaminase/5-amino-6-(5-phosphoribosylamino)uracil reductase
MTDQESPRPRVTIHYAQTLDGRIATCTGNSQWISGDGSLRLAHELRAAHQAVMVGIGTALVDNPRLTLRLAPGRTPLRVVADSTLRLPLDSHLLSDGDAPTVVATTSRAPRERIDAVRASGAEVLVIAQDPAGRVDLPALFAQLFARGIGSLLIEGGGCLITSALHQRLVDRLVVCIAPKLIGAGIEAIGDLRILRLAEALTFSRCGFTPLGEDMIFDGELSPAGAGDGHKPAAHDRAVVSTASHGGAAPGAAATPRP